MSITLSKKTAKNLSNMSKLLKIKENTFLENAIQYYIDNEINLKKEFNDWDNLSDETLINFEKKLI